MSLWFIAKWIKLVFWYKDYTEDNYVLHITGRFGSTHEKADRWELYLTYCAISLLSMPWSTLWAVSELVISICTVTSYKCQVLSLLPCLVFQIELCEKVIRVKLQFDHISSVYLQIFLSLYIDTARFIELSPHVRN